MSEGEPPTEGEPSKRLNDLDDRLRRLRERAPEEEEKVVPRGGNSPQTAYGFAFRIGVELVVALAVGGGIGWLLDHWLGTLPLFLLVFFVLGAVAGLLNVFRAAKQMNRDG
jgi:ATP synthase protein I